MAAGPARRFGPYEVIALLGTGGMGEVYRARDPRLNRDVAIKVVARAATDPARQRRFTEEARAASALNHPNILTVHDVGTHDGTPYIVSELVEGTSLRTMLGRARLSVREALDLGVQMAEGLAAAHQAGIVHRDFKPENVMVTREGRVKILDFGLALVGVRDGISASEVDVTLSKAGMIVGTVPYMSPEQARGATVDYRTDQFSLGLTLYEMVTGRRAFRAETAAQVLAAILDDEPEPIGTLNPRVPAPLRWAIERCLAKDAHQRYDATSDLARELRTWRDRLPELTSSIEIAAAAPRRRWFGTLVATGALAVAAVGVLVGLMSGSGDLGLDRYRFTPIATDPGYQGSPAWSPDGKTLAYVADVDGILQIFTRALASSMRAQVTRARFDSLEPFWSPDGRRLYYISLARERDGLWSISAAGGEPELVMENVSRAALSRDGKTLAFLRSENNDFDRLVTLWLSSPPGAAPARYTREPYGMRGFSDATLHFSPDGSKLGVWASSWLADKTTAVRPPSPGKYEPDLWIIPTGEADPHVAPRLTPDFGPYAITFSWLPDSRHIVTALRPLHTPGGHIWLADTERPFARPLTVSSASEVEPAVSPDGLSIAVSIQERNYDIVELDVDRPTPSMLLATSRNEADPAWSPTGGQMAFMTDRSGRDEIWLRSPSGEWELPLVTAENFGASQTYLVSAPVFSPDGQRVAYHRLGSDGNRVWITPVAGGPPVQVASDEHSQDYPSWSPDGAWIAYLQGLRGEWALVKVRVGATLPPEILAKDIVPDSRVAWSPDGAWIAYNGRAGLTLVSPEGNSTRVIQEQPWYAFAWSADSRQLYGIRPSDDFHHLTFTSVDIRSALEHVLAENFLALPLSPEPVSGFSRISPTRFATSVVHVQSDVWLLEGFNAPQGRWARLAGALRFWRQP